jgi:CubicO group peptidase (beta-lactamase class C family)
MRSVIVSSLEDDRDLHDEPVVPWWSFTKTAIAATALSLVARGKITLDEPLTAKPYTLRQLLQHRAGLCDYGALPDYHAAVASARSHGCERRCCRVRRHPRCYIRPERVGCIPTSATPKCET